MFIKGYIEQGNRLETWLVHEALTTVTIGVRQFDISEIRTDARLFYPYANLKPIQLVASDEIQNRNQTWMLKTNPLGREWRSEPSQIFDELHEFIHVAAELMAQHGIKVLTIGQHDPGLLELSVQSGAGVDFMTQLMVVDQLKSLGLYRSLVVELES